MRILKILGVILSVVASQFPWPSRQPGKRGRHSKEEEAEREATMAALVRMLEPFSVSLIFIPRQGFRQRGVVDGQRFGDHISALIDICMWANSELSLGFDLKKIIFLCTNHDRYKGLVPDEARVGSTSGLSLAALLRKLERKLWRGFSDRERKKELKQALRAMNPYFEERAPKVQEEIELALRAYFLRPRGWKIAVRFVHSMGQVLDAHVGLWYASNRQMDVTPQNIRSLTEKLADRLDDSTARLYWKAVKEQFSDVLLQVYPEGPEFVMAQ